MRFLTARRLALAALAPALLLFSVVPGCSNESEGERCGNDQVLDSDDCQDGFTCIPAAMLLNSNGANRCCREAANDVTDSRCLRSTTAPAGGGSGGTGGVDGGGTGGTDGGIAAGDAATAGVGGN